MTRPIAVHEEQATDTVNFSVNVLVKTVSPM